MEQIVQLKAMRDEAAERLRNNPDFKLMNSLDALIRDLEAVIPVQTDSHHDEETGIQPGDSTDENMDLEQTNETFVGSEIEAAEVNLEEQTPDQNAEFVEMGANEPGDVSDAIEALEAELAQPTSDSDDVTAQPGSMINYPLNATAATGCCFSFC